MGAIKTAARLPISIGANILGMPGDVAELLIALGIDFGVVSSLKQVLPSSAQIINATVGHPETFVDKAIDIGAMITSAALFPGTSSIKAAAKLDFITAAAIYKSEKMGKSLIDMSKLYGVRINPQLGKKIAIGIGRAAKGAIKNDTIQASVLGAALWELTDSEFAGKGVASLYSVLKPILRMNMAGDLHIPSVVEEARQLGIDDDKLRLFFLPKDYKSVLYQYVNKLFGNKLSAKSRGIVEAIFEKLGQVYDSIAQAASQVPAEAGTLLELAETSIKTSGTSVLSNNPIHRAIKNLLYNSQQVPTEALEGLGIFTKQQLKMRESIMLAETSVGDLITLRQSLSKARARIPSPNSNVELFTELASVDAEIAGRFISQLDGAIVSTLPQKYGEMFTMANNVYGHTSQVVKGLVSTTSKSTQYTGLVLSAIEIVKSIASGSMPSALRVAAEGGVLYGFAGLIRKLMDRAIITGGMKTTKSLSEGVQMMAKSIFSSSIRDLGMNRTVKMIMPVLHEHQQEDSEFADISDDDIFQMYGFTPGDELSFSTSTRVGYSNNSDIDRIKYPNETYFEDYGT